MAETLLVTTTVDKISEVSHLLTGLQTPEKSDQAANQRSQHTPRTSNSTRLPLPGNPVNARSLNNAKANGQQGEEWGDEDGDFELEEDISATLITNNLRTDLNQAVLAKTKSVPQLDPSFPTPPETGNEDTTSIDQSSSQADANTEINITVEIPNSSQLQTNEAEERITKFGRKVLKPNMYSPNSAKGSRIVPKTSARSVGRPPKKTTKTNGKATGITKRPRREPSPVVAEDVLCSICNEGQSPKHNRIVLCDSCDIPFHQQCHKPTIDDYVTEVRDASWFCSECEEAKHGGKKRKIESSELPIGESGEEIPEEKKKKYLASLSMDILINLVLHAEKLHPNLPIYPHHLKESELMTGLHPIPNVVINSFDQARAIETEKNVKSLSIAEMTVENNMKSPTPPPQSSLPGSALSNEAHLLPARQLPSVQEQTYPMQTHVHTYSSSSSSLQDTSPMHAHLPPATTLIQAPQSSTFAFSLTTLSGMPKTIRAPQALLPSPITANLPSYEEMIVEALTAINNPDGSQPKHIFDKMESTYPLHAKFRASASQALQKAVRKGRVFKLGTVYILNPTYTGPSKLTRRIQRKDTASSDNHLTFRIDSDNFSIYKDEDNVLSSTSTSSNEVMVKPDVDSVLHLNSNTTNSSHISSNRSAFAAYPGSLPRPQPLQLPPTLPSLSSVAGSAFLGVATGQQNGYNVGQIGNSPLHS
ncbi:hypothetical protein G9A89_010633 [Geosiphon pyriformis]|nr:hypothetical protein G9A89_010633 [Geosiphon pyriformis]